MKRVVALSLVLLFLLAGFPVLADNAQKTSRLIVIDDSIVTVPAATPILIQNDGTVLLPIDIFAKAFHVTYKINQKDNTITVYKGNSFINFMQDDVVKLLDGSLSVAKSIHNGSKSYVQASAVASELGRIYTMLLGTIPRVKTRNATLLDSDVIKIIHSRPLLDNPIVSSPSHYVCLIGLSDNLDKQLEYLKKTDGSAMFFVTRSELLNHPKDILSILASGQSIGFTVENGFKASGTSAYIREFNQCNVILNKLARTSSALVILPNGSADNTDTVQAVFQKSGYRLWRYSYDYSKNNLRVISKLRWNSLIYIDNSDAYLLDDLIVYMKKNAFGVKSASDATTPVNFNVFSG